MGKITLTQDNTPLRQMISGLDEGISHFNLLFYNTDKPPLGSYGTSDTVGTDIIPARELVNAENFKPIGYTDLAIGVSSSVRMKSGRFYHLKQLDIDQNLGSPTTFINTIEKIVDGMRGNHEVGSRVEGFLVNSGSGIHYYESGLLTEKGWQAWIEKAQNVKEVDTTWTNLSSTRGFSTLRISATKQKPVSPVVFCRFSYKE